jgi:hypothetical protein
MVTMDDDQHQKILDILDRWGCKLITANHFHGILIYLFWYKKHMVWKNIYEILQWNDRLEMTHRQN